MEEKRQSQMVRYNRLLILLKVLNSAVSHDLPYYSKYLLCAAYLASYNPAKQDAIYFVKSSEKKRRRRGGGATPGREKHRKV